MAEANGHANAGIPGLEELRASFRGSVLLPGDAGFRQALQVWAVSPAHGKAPPTPALVLQPRGTSDVVQAVEYAAAAGLELAVKCGGHGGSVYVDPAAKTAVVDGGCLAADIDSETALHGLAAPLGICPVVGIGGLALNGGLSLLSRAFGPICDNILEATVVLANGSVVVTNEQSDPELFWALKGVGTTLGVVTKLKLRLYDSSSFHCGAFVWRDDPEHATFKAILRYIRDVVCPHPSMGFNLARAIAPDLGPLLISMVALTDDASEAEKEALLQPLRDLGPIQDSVGKSTWRQTQCTHMAGIQGLTTAFPVHYEGWTGGQMDTEQLSDSVIDTMVRLFADKLPLPECGISLCFIELIGGACKRTQAPIGFAVNDVHWVMQAGWTDPATHAAGLAYVARLREALALRSSVMEAYINVLDTAAGGELSYEKAAEKVNGAANLERLRAVKARVDPGNTFRHSPFTKVLAVAAK